MEIQQCVDSLPHRPCNTQPLISFLGVDMASITMALETMDTEMKRCGPELTA